MSSESVQKRIPPYGAYSTFSFFINGLKESGIPERIDRSVMSKMSGAQQTAIIAALKFFGLIDSTSKPTSKLPQLVDADEKSYSMLLKQMLEENYTFLTAGGLNLERASGSQVAERFRENDITGSTVAKAMAFYIAAAKVAGIKLSPHIKPPAVPQSQGAKRVRRKDEKDPVDPPPPRQPVQAPKSWQEQLLEKFPAFDPSWDDATKGKWFESFEKLMQQAPKKEGSE